MARDIDYAATAVKAAIVEKYGRATSLENLQVTAKEKAIELRDGNRLAEGTRDVLLAAVRKAENYDDLWQNVPVASR